MASFLPGAAVTLLFCACMLSIASAENSISESDALGVRAIATGINLVENGRRSLSTKVSDVLTEGVSHAKAKTPSPPPPYPFPPSRYSAYDKNIMVYLHGALRKKVANLKPLTYNNYLAGYAQQWADQQAPIACASKGVGGNYGASLTYRPKNLFGENIFYGWYPAKDTYTAEAVFNFWASQKASYNYAANTCAKGKYCGDYIQIVWHLTKSFGCGVATCPLKYNRGYTFKIVVCDYADIGYTGGRPY